MIRPSLLVASAALAFFTAAVAQGGTHDVRATMQQRVNPAMLAIWGVGNDAMNDEGGLDSALLDDTKWALIATEARKLAAAGRDMASATAVVAASPGNDAVGEGEMAMALVQRHLDDDPAGFRKMGAEFAAHADKLAVAASAKDIAATGELIGQMDAVCETCHAHFWYPE